MLNFRHSNSGPIEPGDRFKEWSPTTIKLVGGIVMVGLTLLFAFLVKSATVGFFGNDLTGTASPKYDPIHTLPYYIIGKQPLGLILLAIVILGFYAVYKLAQKAENAEKHIVDETTKVIKSDSNAYGSSWMLTDDEIKQHFNVCDLSETDNIVLGQLPSDSDGE